MDSGGWAWLPTGEGGFEAMLVPSARRSEGTKMVIFPDQLVLGSELMLLGKEDLPPQPRVLRTGYAKS